MPKQFLEIEQVPLYFHDRDRFSLLTKLFVSRVTRDRFGFLNHLSPYNIDNTPEAMPKYVRGISIHDIMDAYAVDVITRYNKIALAWSGGIDSTAMVVAFLKHLPRNEYDRLVICGTDLSIEEYPEFYKHLKDLGISIIINNALFTTIGNVECDVLLTGFGADSMFGMPMFEEAPYLYNASVETGVKDTWSLRYKKSRLPRRTVEGVAQLFVEYGKFLGVDVTQFCEAAWVFTFGCRITTGYTQTRLLIAEHPNHKKSFSFYQSPAYTDWAYSQFEHIKDGNVYSSPLDYKRPLREYIYAYDKCERYYREKLKYNSLLGVTDYPIHTIAVSSADGITYYKAEEDDVSFSAFERRVANLYRKEPVTPEDIAYTGACCV